MVSAFTRTVQTPANKAGSNMQAVFPAIFAVGFPAIKGINAILIRKHPGGIFKTNSTIAQIYFCFVRVPIKFHEANMLHL